MTHPTNDLTAPKQEGMALKCVRCGGPVIVHDKSENIGNNTTRSYRTYECVNMCPAQYTPTKSEAATGEDGEVVWLPVETLKPEPNKSYLVSDGVHRWFAPLSGKLYEDMKDLREKLRGFQESEDEQPWTPTHWMDTGLPGQSPTPQRAQLSAGDLYRVREAIEGALGHIMWRVDAEKPECVTDLQEALALLPAAPENKEA